MEKLLEYLVYKTTYENAPPREDIPDFYERIVPEVALELYVVLFYSFSARRLRRPIISPLQIKADHVHSLTAADFLESARLLIFRLLI